jgi:hypothetical protein
MHTMRYKHIVHIDSENAFGHGIGAVISQGGEDKYKAHLLAPNILGFLE